MAGQVVFNHNSKAWVIINETSTTDISICKRGIINWIGDAEIITLAKEINILSKDKIVFFIVFNIRF